ncbi:hypothetical protein KI387_019850, partial [Taxus chinensis]
NSLQLEAMKKGNVKFTRHDSLNIKDDDKPQQLALEEENEQSFSEEEDNGSSEEEENSISEEEELQEHLADIPFEELQRVRSDGRESTFVKLKQETKPSRANKNRPMEMSSKKPVGRLREVVQAPKK